jgi:uncharacterized repeat protein (TIGR03803 family)
MRRGAGWDALGLVVILGLAVVVIPSAQAQTFTVLYTFTGPPDGALPYGGLVEDATGNFYGTTAAGGTGNCNHGVAGCGTVFKVDSNGKETILYRFNGGADGDFPVAGLLMDTAGNLYGTTQNGGDPTCEPPHGCGVIFEIDTNGKETVLHTFEGPDGAFPLDGLVQDSAGNLYGTAEGGGKWTFGVVFELESNGKEKVLHSFGGNARGDGAFPSAGLIQDSIGNFYGTTGSGGFKRHNFVEGCGTVFKLDKDGEETVLHKFTEADGATPIAGLFRDAGGNLYGTTYTGVRYAQNFGTIFKVATNGKENLLHLFDPQHGDGGWPQSGLVRDKEGAFYGTTSIGGTNYKGTAFKLQGRKVSILHNFAGADGADPHATLVLGTDGSIYGATIYGGNGPCNDGVGIGCGVLFKITP